MDIRTVDWPRLYQAFEAGAVDPALKDDDHASRLRHILMRRTTSAVKFQSAKIKAVAKNNAIEVQLHLAGQWYRFITI